MGQGQTGMEVVAWNTMLTVLYTASLARPDWGGQVGLSLGGLLGVSMGLLARCSSSSSSSSSWGSPWASWPGHTQGHLSSL